MSELIEQIKTDHREVEEYFNRYKSSSTSEKGNKWFNAFVLELCRHAVAEELVLYPLLEHTNEKGKMLAKQSREEHQATKEALHELRNISDPVLFDEKFDALMKNLSEHIAKEEKEDLVFLGDNVTPALREAAGKKFALNKKIVPTHPHPGVPDRPMMLEAILGMMIAPIDKFKDLFADFPEGVN